MKSTANKTFFRSAILKDFFTSTMLLVLMLLSFQTSIYAQQPSGCMLDTGDSNPPGILDCTNRLGWCLEPSLNFCNNVKHVYDIAPDAPPTTGMVANECATSYIMWVAEYTDGSNGTWTEDEMQQAIWAIQDVTNYPAASTNIQDLVDAAVNYCNAGPCGTTLVSSEIEDSGSCSTARYEIQTCDPYFETTTPNVYPCNEFSFEASPVIPAMTNSKGNIYFANTSGGMNTFYICQEVVPCVEEPFDLCVREMNLGTVWVWNDQDTNDPDVAGCQYIGGLPEPECIYLSITNDCLPLTAEILAPELCLTQGEDTEYCFAYVVQNVPGLCDSPDSDCGISNFYNNLAMEWDYLDEPGVTFVSGELSTTEPDLEVYGSELINTTGNIIEGSSNNTGVGGFTSTGGNAGTYILDICVVVNTTEDAGVGNYLLKPIVKNLTYFTPNGNGTLELNFTESCDLQNPTSLSVTTKAPGCTISDAGLINVDCNDQGTDSDMSDDVITFDLDPTGVTLSGSGYTVSASSGTVVPTSGTYGAPTSFELGMGSAGMGDVTITLTDVDDANCTLEVIVADPGTCSNPSCNLSPTVTNITCDANGTPDDATDDKILFDLEVTGATGSYGVSTSNSMAITPSSGNYDAVVSYEIAAGSAGGGDITITITDATDMTCTTTSVVTDPGTCSTGGGCEINTPAGTATCDPNGTPSDASDDKIVYTVNLTGNGVGSTYNVSVSGGITIMPTSGSYNTPVVFMLPAGSAGTTGDFTVTFTDVDDGTCSNTQVLTDPGTCTGAQCAITADGLRMVMCNDGGTPDDTSDDFVTFVLEPTASNASTTYDLSIMGTTVTPTSGTYGVGTTFTLPAGSVNGATNYSYSITDSEDPTCYLRGSFITPTCTITVGCDIVGEATEIMCNDSGTTNDATDDFITFNLNVLDALLDGSGYTISASSGSATPSTGVIGTAMDVALQSGSAGGGAIILTITSVSEPSCSTTVSVSDPGICSMTTSCILTSAGLDNIVCNDSASDADATDDYITFDLNPVGMVLGATYNVAVSSGSVTPTSGAYGAPTTFTMQAGSAGNGDVTISLVDVADASCTFEVDLRDPGSCSTGVCNITGVGLSQVECNDNGSSDNTTDDFISLSLNVTGNLTGATYNVSVSGGTISPTSGTYGSANAFTLQNGSAGGGDVVITVEDVDGGAACSLTATVTDPGICSSENCLVNLNLDNISCNANGTPTVEGDDFITFELNPTGTGLGGFYNVTVGSGTVTPSSGTYGSSTSFMLQIGGAGAGDVSVQISDANDPSCVSSGTVIDPGTCSVSCPPFDPHVICDDGSVSLLLEADSGLSSIIWYNGDDVEIGTGASITVDSNTPGLADGLESFYYTANDANGCEGLVCCPVFVETEVCCAIEVVGYSGDCMNNGSTTDDQDDYFIITVESENDANATGTYEVVFNGMVIGTADYGTELMLGSFPNTYFYADGSTSYTLTIRDTEKPSECSIDYVSTPVESCSNCNMIPEAIPYDCNDNNTPLDPSDDYVLIEVSADNVGAGPSDMYAVYYDGTLLGMMTYNLDIEVGNNIPRPFVADGVTTYLLTWNDVDDPLCSGTLEVGPFDPCSDDCEITFTGSVSECFDNGTLTDASDDYFTVTVDASVVNGAGTEFEVVIGADLATGNGGTVIGTGTYGTTLVVGDATTPPFSPDGVTDYHIVLRNIGNDCWSLMELGPVSPCALITHEKDIVSVNSTNVGNTYDVTYSIVVTNEGGSTGTYGLVDTPAFDDDIIINEASFFTNFGLSDDLLGSGPWSLTSNESIGAGGIHTYTITVNVTLDLYPGSGGGDDTYTACGLGNPGTPPSANQGLYNQSALDLNDDGTPEEVDDACDDLPFITHEKSIGDVTQVGVHTYDVVYVLTVTNVGGATGDYDLVDMPNFDNDITIQNASFVSTGVGAGLPHGLANVGPWVMADNATIANGDIHTYTLTVRVEIALEDEGAGSDLGDNDYDACGEGGSESCYTDELTILDGSTPSSDIREMIVTMAGSCPGEGLFNFTLLDTNNDGNPEEEDNVCDDLPYIILDKTANEVTMVPNDPFRYNITYTIDVCNIGGAVGTYDLFDTPMFDADILIEGASYTSTAPDWTGDDLTGSGPYTLADDQDLPDGECHTFTVSFDVFLDIAPDSQTGNNEYTECGENSPGGEPVPFQGLFNQATIDTNNDGTPDDVADDCKDIPRVFDLALIKTTTEEGPFSFGDIVTFTIQVQNQGNVPATDVKVVDYLPSGFANVAGNAPVWNYDAASHISNTEIPGTIYPTDSYFLTIDLVVVPTMDYATGWTNYAEIWTHSDEDGNPIVDIDSTPDADNTNDSGGEPMGDTDNELMGDGTGPIGSGPASEDEDDHDPEKIEIFDLALKKELVTLNDPYRYGDLLEFKLTVCNQGNIGAEDVVISDYIPAGYGFDLADNAGWTGAAPEAMTTITEIAVETCEEVSIFLTIQQTTGGEKDWVNYSEIQSANNEMGEVRDDWDIDSNPDSDNEDENDVEPNDPLDDDLDSHDKGGEEDDHDPAGIELLDLALRKVTANQTGPYEYGDVVSFTIELYNQGSIQASDVVVTDYIPCGYTYMASNDALGWSYDAATGDATMTVVGPILPGAPEATTVSIDLALTQCLDMDDDSFTNYAEISDYTSDDPDYPDPEDVDSMTDTDEENDEGGTPDDPNEDDNIEGDKYNDEDEDDHDPERVEIFDLALKKELVTINDPYRYGDKLTFTMTVCNQGNVDAANVVVEDYVPAGYNFDFADNAAWGGTVADPTYTVPGVIAQDECVSFDIVLTIQMTSGGEKDWVNYSEIVSSTDTDDNPRVDADSEEGTDNPTEDGVEPGDDADDDLESTDKGGEEDDHDPAGIELFDLALRKELVSSGSFVYGDVVEFSISIFNQGSIEAANIEITDYLPCGFIYDASNDALGWSNVGGQITRTYEGPLAAGANDAVSFFAQLQECYVDEASAWTNYAEISNSESTDPDNTDPEDVDSMTDNDPDNDMGGTPNDPNEDDNIEGDKYDGEDEDDHDPAYVPIFDLAIKKTVDSIGPYVPGDIVDFDIKVYNQGNVTGYDVVVTDYLNAGFIFDAAINPGWVNTAGLVETTLSDPFAPGDSVALVLKLEVQILPTSAHGDWYNEVEISDGNNKDGVKQEDADSMPDTDPDNDNDLVDGPDDDNIFNGDNNDNVIDEHKHDPFNEGDDDEDDNDAVEILVTSELGDYVWKDDNGDGIQDADESGLGNVLVYLFDCDGNLLETDTTDATGYYLFDLLLPGNYQVQFDLSNLPEGCAFTPQNQGSDDALDSDANLQGLTECIYLGPGEMNHTIDAGVLPLAEIGDYVWHDLDADGVQEAGEPGIEGVRVELYNGNGILMGIAYTDASGEYLFDNLYPGDYYIKFYSPEGKEQTFQNQGGNDALDSDIDGSNGDGTTQTTTLSAGESDLTWDAGYYMCIPIGDLVWLDTDLDNVWDVKENGINGIKVEAYRQDENGDYILWDFTYTGHKPGTPSDDGYWLMCVPPGTYYAKFVVPPYGLVTVAPNIGIEENDSDVEDDFGKGTTANFTVFSGDTKTDVGAGYAPMATLGDRVWFDDNGNGMQEGTEAGVPNVGVKVFDQAGNLVDETVTNDDGEYLVDYLKGSQYYLEFMPPAGYSMTQANVGPEFKDSDVDNTFGLNTTGLVATRYGEHTPNIDAGLATGFLPADYSGFWGENRTEVNFLEWTMVNESNIDYYVVERQLNNATDFIAIGNVSSKGNADINTYDFIDADIAEEGIYYYRINKMDLNGASQYSDIISIKVDASTVGNAFGSSIYPNPASEEFTIEVDLVSFVESVEITLRNAAGQVISKDVRLDRDVAPGIHKYQVNSKDLPEGIYNVELNVGGDRMIKKLIIVAN